MGDLRTGGGAVEAMMERFARRKNRKEGDYEDDEGFLCCGTCKERKQIMMRWFDKGERKVPVICKCEEAERDEHERKIQRYGWEARVSELRKLGIEDSRLESWRFDNDDRRNPKVSDAMLRYVEQWDDMKARNKGLLLYGGVGTGKTFLAACVANALIDQGEAVMMTTFIRIIQRVSNKFGNTQEQVDMLAEYPLLIIDDFGAERGTEYVTEQVYNIIDTRYRSGKPLIMTTNMEFEDIKNPKDLSFRRITDRVLEMCHPIKVDGPSRRREKLKDAFADMNRILGL